METQGIDYMCPICKDYLLQPRIYECGHTICERCMINCDKSVKSEVKTGSSEELRIIDITVEEKPTGEISASAGVGTAGSSIGAGIRENNF